MRPVVVALSLLVLAAACGGHQQTSRSAVVLDAYRQAKANGMTEQAAILRDGQVTQAEYQDAYNSAAHCAGIPPLQFQTSPIDSLRLVPTNLPTPVPQRLPPCQLRLEELVESTYLATHDARMEAGLRRSVAACLTKVDVRPSKAWSNVAQLRAAAGIGADSAVDQCINTSMGALYPQITTFAI